MSALKKKITLLIFILNNITCGVDIEILENEKCNPQSFAKKIFEKEIISIDEKSLDNLCILEKRSKFSCDEPDTQQSCCDLTINLCCYNELGYVFCRWL
jgi:hypothetical protein